MRNNRTGSQNSETRGCGRESKVGKADYPQCTTGTAQRSQRKVRAPFLLNIGLETLNARAVLVLRRPEYGEGCAQQSLGRRISDLVWRTLQSLSSPFPQLDQLKALQAVTGNTNIYITGLLTSSCLCFLPEG